MSFTDIMTTPDWNHTISLTLYHQYRKERGLENLMKRRFNLTVVAAGALAFVLLAVAACVPVPPAVAPAAAPAAAPASASSNTITGIVWQWVSVTDQTTRPTTTVPNPASYTIIFNVDGTTSGKADCNSFTGTWSQQNGFHIQVVPNRDGRLRHDDSQYLTLLKQVAAGGPDGAGDLTLETAGGAQRMLFRNGGPGRPRSAASIQQHDHGHRLAVDECDGQNDQADDDRAEPSKLHHHLQRRWHHVRQG